MDNILTDWYRCLWKINICMAAFALHSCSRNCSAAPDLVFWMMIFAHLFASPECFVHTDTSVGRLRYVLWFSCCLNMELHQNFTRTLPELYQNFTRIPSFLMFVVCVICVCCLPYFPDRTFAMFVWWCLVACVIVAVCCLFARIPYLFDFMLLAWFVLLVSYYLNNIIWYYIIVHYDILYYIVLQYQCFIILILYHIIV